MAAADLGDRRPVAVGRDGCRQGRADDRLGHERGDGAGPRGLDRPVELLRQLVAVAERVRARLARAVRVRGGDVAEPPSHASYGRRSGLRPDRSSAPRVLPW